MGASHDSDRLGASAGLSSHDRRCDVRVRACQRVCVEIGSTRSLRFRSRGDIQLHGNADTQAFAHPCFDTLLISSVLEVEPATRGMIDLLRRSLPMCRRIGFDMHWRVLPRRSRRARWQARRRIGQFVRNLRDRFPKVKVGEDRIFIPDGSVWTAAGMSAGLDLALGMIKHDFWRSARAIRRAEAPHPSSPCGRPVPAFRSPGA